MHVTILSHSFMMGSAFELTLITGNLIFSFIRYTSYEIAVLASSDGQCDICSFQVPHRHLTLRRLKIGQRLLKL